MTGSEKLLCTLTMRRWLGLSAAERSVGVDALLELAPDDLVLAAHVGLEVAPPLPFFIHQPTQLGFFLVFGDLFTVGASPDDLRTLEVRWGKDPTPNTFESNYVSGPRHFAVLRDLEPHPVDVAPYFLAETTLTSQWHERFGLHDLPEPSDFNETARRHIEERGWRLPSEVELEVADRLYDYSGQVGFRRVQLGTGWCADTWHASNDGAPTTSEAWGDDATVLRPSRLAGRERFDLAVRRAQLRPAFPLLRPEVAWSSEARAARANLGAWRLRALNAPATP